jgi:hypothetical protein
MSTGRQIPGYFRDILWVVFLTDLIVAFFTLLAGFIIGFDIALWGGLAAALFVAAVFASVIIFNLIVIAVLKLRKIS